MLCFWCSVVTAIRTVQFPDKSCTLGIRPILIEKVTGCVCGAVGYGNPVAHTGNLSPDPLLETVSINTLPGH